MSESTVVSQEQMASNDEWIIQTIKQQDIDFAKQYKFKYFKDEIISVLQLFEKSKEWADLIKCLKRLQVIVKKYSTYPAIPEKITLCKRLAQCLNPQLPSGVHLKVLETLDIIYQHIGGDRLAVDVSIYSSGLLSFLPHASLQTKPIVLDLLERYHCNLSVHALISCISGLQVAVLSAMEEESVDISGKAKAVMDKLLSKFTPIHTDIFYSNMWRIILLSPLSRVAAFGCITGYLKKLKSEEQDFKQVFANDLPLVIASIVAALNDNSPTVLVQRAALEFLHSQITFDQLIVSREDYITLLRNSLLLLRRKDLSINRRLFQWLFGNSAAEFNEEYFNSHVLGILVDTLRNMLDTDFHKSLSLTVIVLLLQNDFPAQTQSQICSSIIEQVLYYLHRHISTKDQESDVVVASFTSLFPLLEPKSMIWDTLTLMLKNANALSSSDEKKYFELVDLIGTLFNILYTDQLQAGLLISLEESLLEFLSRRIQSPNPDVRIIDTSLLLCINIYTKIPESTTRSVELYAKAEQVFTQFVDNIMLAESGSNHEFNEIFKTACTFMSILLLPDTNQDHRGIPLFLQKVYDCCAKHKDSHVAVFSIETFLGILTKESGIDYRVQQSIIKNSNGYNQLECIISTLWGMLAPKDAIIHFEVVKLLVEIHALNRKLCNRMISEYMLDSRLEQKIDAHQKFAVIWRLIDDLGIDQRVFDDGLFLMLDSIKSDDSNLRLVGRSWLIASFRNIYRVLDPLFQTLIDQEYLSRVDMVSSSSNTLKTNADVAQKLRSPYDFERCKYVLNIWNAMVQVAPRNFIQRTMELKLTDDITNNFMKFMGKSFYLSDIQYPSTFFQFDRKDYYSLIVTTCVQFMECGISFEQKKHHTINEITTLEESIRTKSIMFLRDLLVNGKVFKRTTDFASALVECVLSHLRNSVEAMDGVFQVELLGMLHTLLSHLHSCSVGTAAITDNAALLDSTLSPVLVLVHSPNFLPTLLQGVSVASDAQVNNSYYSYALLNYWIDYIGSFLPYLETALPFVITALVPHICSIIRDNAIAGIDSLRSQAIQKLLEGLKKMLTYCVLEFNNVGRSIEDIEVMQDEQPGSVISSAVMPFKLITGLVRDVFTSEEIIVKPSTLSPATEAQQFMLSELPNIIETMAIVWKALRNPYKQKEEIQQRKSATLLGLVQYGSLHTKYAIEQAIVHFIDPLVAKHKSHLVASLVLLWGNLHPEVENSVECQLHELDSHIMDILNNVDSASPDTVMSSIVDVIVSLRHNRGGKQASQVNSPEESDDPNMQPSKARSMSNTIVTFSDLTGKSAKLREHVALSFLHIYLRKCILTNKGADIINKLLRLVRDSLFMPNASPIPVQSLDLLVICALLKALYSYLVRWPIPAEDKRMRTRILEAFHKLTEAGLQCCVREMNTRKAQFTKATKSSKLGPAEKEHLIRRELHDPYDPSIQFLILMSTHLQDFMEKVPHEYTPTSNLITLMTAHIMTILKNNSLINIPRLYYTVVMLSKFNASMLNMRVLRKEIWDLFNLPAFFKVQSETIETWKRVFHTLINGGETIDNSQVTTDEDVLLFEQQQYIQRENKSLITDLLNRFSGTQSIFTSRDSEAIQRANLLKRLAFMLYVGELDDYYSFLPLILEKIVESLRLSPSPATNNILITNTLFCLRVLVTRISPNNLAPIWPMVTTELIKLFTNLEQSNFVPSDGDGKVILEALKFIDLVMVVLPQEFHLFKWMFIKRIAESGEPKVFQVFEPYVYRIIQDYNPEKHSEKPLSSTQSNSCKRKPLDTEYLTADWADTQQYAYQLSTQKREKELYCEYAEQGYDSLYIDHLFALDFHELPPEDIMRIHSANFDPKSLEKAESWILISKKPSTSEASSPSKEEPDDSGDNL